ncbi:MAG TPA: protein kinase [Polyangiaceae bacterium]|nr:protein kinase [Polyangiaceae bacterium]
MFLGNNVFATGSTVGGRYRVERVIGEGGMGVVHEVTDLKLERRMALKALREEASSSPEAIRRFFDESKLTVAIRSEHIVEVTDVDTDPATHFPFFVMELLEGENLHAVLKRKGRLPAEEVVRLLHQASLALDKTHAIDIVHRDLKPENLFLTTRDDGSTCLKILDFGIAKVIDPRTHAQITRNVGTPLYMSPEQYDGDPNIDHRTDLYSLAHIAFTLLVGRPYFDEESQAMGKLALSVMSGASEMASRRARRWNVGLPTGFDAWFAKATAKEAFGRFDSASELVEALAIAVGVEAPRASRSLPRSKPREGRIRPSRRNVVGAFVGFAACLGVVASLYGHRERAPENEASASPAPPTGAIPFQPSDILAARTDESFAAVAQKREPDPVPVNADAGLVARPPTPKGSIGVAQRPARLPPISSPRVAKPPAASPSDEY